jgi:hypothetical protein
VWAAVNASLDNLVTINVIEDEQPRLKLLITLKMGNSTSIVMRACSGSSITRSIVPS